MVWLVVLTIILTNNKHKYVMQVDEMGPLFIGNQNGYAKVWVLIAIKVVTQQVHLIPMKHQNTVSFVTSLEILQLR